MMTFFLPTNSPNLSYSTEKLDLGLPSMADYAVEIGGILGAIPGIGNVADLGTGIIAAIKDPPDYLIAAFSILCAIPALGVGIAFAKEAVKSAGKEGAPGVAKVLQKELSEKGIALDSTMLSKIKKQYTSFLGSITAKGRVDAIAKLTNHEADLITSRLGETKKYIDDIVDNLKVVGKSSKGIDNLSSAVARRTTAKVMEELASGQLRNVCVKWASDLAQQLPKKFKVVPDDMIGKKFLHNKTGKEIVFNSFKQFKDEYKQACKYLDIPDSEAEKAFMKYYADAAEKVGMELVPVKPKNIEAITDSLLAKMKDIKIEIVTDPAIAKGPLYEMGDSIRGMMVHGDPPEIAINFAVFAKEGLEKDIQETMEHELIHAVDKLLLTVLAGGNEAAEALIKSKGIRLASQLTAETGALIGRGGKELDRYIYTSTELSKKMNIQGMPGLTNWQWYLAKEGQSPSGLAYISKPQEMFVRVQRVSYWLKANGFKPNQWDEFFRRNPEEMISEVPDADYFRPFFKLFKIVYEGTPNKTSKKVVDDLYAMFDALI